MYRITRLLRTGSFWLALFSFLVAGICLLPFVYWPAGQAQEIPTPKPPDEVQAPSAASAVMSWEYDQIQPAVAFNSGANRYLAVWEDQHWGWGADWDIFGRLIDANGIPFGGQHIGVSYDGSNQRLDPAVTSNGTTEFLVVWQYAFSLTDHDIYARRVDTSGSVVGGELGVTTSTYYESRPVVAFDSYNRRYLVVWERRIGDEEFGQRDIYGQFLNENGSLYGSEIAIATSTANEAYPALAYSSSDGSFLVVWQGRNVYGDYDIIGQRVNAVGLVGGQFTICYSYEANDQLRPRLAYDWYDSRYLVVWEDHFSGASNWDINGQLVNANGTLYGSNFSIASTAANNTLYPDVAYNSATGEFQVAYEYEYSTTDHDVYWQRVTYLGGVPDPEKGLSTYGSHEGRPAIAAGAGSQAVVVWEDGRNAQTLGLDIFTDVASMYAFSGKVFDGNLGDESKPLGYVQVDLYCSANAGSPGSLIAQASTNPHTGYFFLVTSQACGYYNIIETDPSGYISVSATSIGGVVVNSNWIQYSSPLAGKELGSNKFWDKPPATPTNTPTRTATATASKTPSLTPTRTATATITLTPSHTPSQTPTASQTASLTPSLTPSQTPTHTATPSLTPTWTPTATDTPTPPSGPRPDLLITDIWPQGHLICHQIFNQGQAAAPGNYQVELLVDDSSRMIASGRALAPGERWSSCIDYHWDCTQPADQIAVVADADGSVPESDENNNSRQEEWPCDTNPPVILSGPAVDQITTSSVRIRWETDEDSTSWVEYGSLAGLYPEVEGSAVMTTSHNVRLTGLLPFKTYHYRVESRDAFGNLVQSSDYVFQTHAAIDHIDPILIFNPPATVTETVVMTSTVSDDQGVSRVLFYLDGLRAFTDYSPPYEYRLDSNALENGPHQIEAQAFDLVNNHSSQTYPVNVANLKDPTLPVVNITAPLDGATVADKVEVKATLTDDTGIISARFYMDGDYQQFEPYDVNNPPKNTNVTFVWDSRAYPDYSQHRLAIEAYDKSGNRGIDYVDITVYNPEPTPEPSPPWLEVVGHSVIRTENKLLVFLTIKNTGDAEARNVTLWDGLVGFQAIGRDTTDVSYLTEWNPVGRWGYADIRPKTPIPAGESRLYAYYAIPVLVSPNPATPQIGYFVDMAWETPTGTQLFHNVMLPVGQTIDGVSIPQAHAEAVKNSDYLLVTNPYRLFAIHNPGYYQGPSPERAKVNAVLSKMAELAYYQQGSLGYNYDNSAQALHSLIQPGGTWNKALFGGYSTFGYLTLVGETNVIPGWGRFYGTQYTTKGDIPFIAPFTDNPYANMFGDENYPELSITRIPGGDAEELAAPLDTAINLAKGQTGYHFDGLLHLAVIGYPAGIGGGADSINFKAEVNEVVKKMSGGVMVMNNPGYNIYFPNGTLDITTTTQTIRNAFINNVKYRDVIFLAGHGNAGSWDVININTVMAPANPFGDTNPFVFASSCLTGDYSGGFSIGESFLWKKAGAYMGAIRVGACHGDTNTCPNADKFFANWNTNKSFARALRDTKASLSDSFHDRYWNGIYHIYGDAKFGIVSSTASAGAGEGEGRPHPDVGLSVVDISVPQVSVEEEDGVHRVTIPEGAIPIDEGHPALPSYTAFFEYPANVQVQSVRLVSRSEPQSFPGLNIPTAVYALPGIGLLLPDDSAPNPEWWPEVNFEWHVVETLESTTLAITLYPFYYNSLTQEGLFYPDYLFDVETHASTVAITRLEPETDILPLGELLDIEVELENNAAGPTEVVVRAYMEDVASGEYLGGLLLLTLPDLIGKAGFALQWDSAGHSPGDYAVHVELLQGGEASVGQPVLLDQASHTIQLGTNLVELSGLEVSPSPAQPGDVISIAFELVNAGETPYTGTVQTVVQNYLGQVVAQFTLDVANLEPANTLPVLHTWNTTGLPEGSYDLAAYLLYGGGESNILTGVIDVYLPQRLYLPLIRR